MTTKHLKTWSLRAWQVLWADLRRFHSRRNLARLAIGLLIGGILANTPVDSWLEDAYFRNIHSEAHAAGVSQWVAKQVGDRYVAIIAPLAAMAAGVLAPANPVAAFAGTWGQQFTRAFVVSAPATYGVTWLLGGDRPKNGHGSAWQPWRWEQKGISGHAMAGALPFLVMAGMSANPAAQTALYICSGLTAWSRVDSRSHYPSQVWLGWWLAFLAARTVRRKKAHATCSDASA